MKKKVIGLALGALLIALSVSAEAQQPARIHRIGILSPVSGSFFSAREEALRQRLRELGYVEGKTFSLSIDMQKGKPSGCLTLSPNWSVLKLISSSPPAPTLH